MFRWPLYSNAIPFIQWYRLRFFSFASSWNNTGVIKANFQLIRCLLFLITMTAKSLTIFLISWPTHHTSLSQKIMEPFANGKTDSLVQKDSTDYITKSVTMWYPVIRYFSSKETIIVNTTYKGLLYFWKYVSIHLHWLLFNLKNSIPFYRISNYSVHF